MGRGVSFTRKMADDFIHLAMLSEEEIYLLESRIKGVTVTQQAEHLHKSEATVHRMIKKIKDKYDLVQKENPDKFPVRYVSNEEKYMDTH